MLVNLGVNLTELLLHFNGLKLTVVVVVLFGLLVKKGLASCDGAFCLFCECSKRCLLRLVRVWQYCGEELRRWWQVAKGPGRKTTAI